MCVCMLYTHTHTHTQRKCKNSNEYGVEKYIPVSDFNGNNLEATLKPENDQQRQKLE